MYDWLIFLAVVGVLLIYTAGVYDLGKEDGWTEAGRWADDHLSDVPLRFMTEDEVYERTRPATRDPNA